jgi:hypothetical protein
LLKQVYARSVFDDVVNRDYEGEVKGEAATVKIPSLARLGWKDYSGSVTYDGVNEIVATFTLDQKKHNAFKIKDLDKFESFIKEPKGTILDQLVDEFKKMVDGFVLGFWSDVAAGQWIGTDYVTGTVTITAVTGAVVGVGTTFTSAMVGKPFQAVGHTAWYRVKTFTDATHIVIEDDLDDVASAYTGGAISGAAYVIQANTALAVTTTTFLDQVAALKQKMDDAEIPETDRFLVIPPSAENTLTRSSNIKINVPAVYEELVKKGFITELLGFKVFKSARVKGDNTNGYHVIAGTRMWLTFADGLIEAPEQLRLQDDFAWGFRELRTYGAKVADERRKFSAHLFATFS